jgi:hypothetical protein
VGRGPEIDGARPRAGAQCLSTPSGLARVSKLRHEGCRTAPLGEEREPPGESRQSQCRQGQECHEVQEERARSAAPESGATAGSCCRPIPPFSDLASRYSVNPLLATGSTRGPQAKTKPPRRDPGAPGRGWGRVSGTLALAYRSVTASRSWQSENWSIGGIARQAPVAPKTAREKTAREGGWSAAFSGGR